MLYICRGQAHHISRCWHVIGVPDRIKTTVDGFKQLKAQGAGPWETTQQIQAIATATQEEDHGGVVSTQEDDILEATEYERSLSFLTHL